jgi:hypothetical protein
MNIKHLLFFLVSLWGTHSAYAQNYSLNLSDTNAKTVEIYLDRGNLRVTGKKGSTLEVFSNYKKENLPDRAAGLKPLTANRALDNTGYGIEVRESNSVIMIQKATNQEIDMEVILPDNVRLVINPESWQAGDIIVKDFRGEIEVKSNSSNIQLLQVSGPVIANSISGNIEIVFQEINPNKPSAVSNISGFIDVSLSPQAKATLEIKNLSGEIFTDLDLEILEEKNFGPEFGNLGNPPTPPVPPTPPAPGKEKTKTAAPLFPTPRVSVGKGITGSYNGGGVAVSLHNISGNIYLRKAK